MNILEVKDLKKYYGQGENQVKALDGISLSVKQGEFLAVVGTSGSGKSTLLHMMGGLDTPTSGRVIVAGKDISTLSRDELTIFRRRKIGFVFQSYNLLPLMNVYDNIVLPIKLDGIRPDETYVEQILVSLGLEEKRCAMPNQLSGGQQQRVALARALAAKPAIILADELCHVSHYIPDLGDHCPGCQLLEYHLPAADSHGRHGLRCGADGARRTAGTDHPGYG